MSEEQPPEFIPYGNQRSKSAGRRVDANLKATAKWFRDRDAAECAVRASEVAASRASETHISDVELADATHVFDSGRRQWREVVKVNAKTVSVATGYSWVDRVPKTRITRARRVDAVQGGESR